MDSMFQTLMQMPLFHGVSYNKLSEILGKHRFHFLKYTDNERIISAGDLCTHLSTVVSGKVRMTISNADGHVKVSQTLSPRTSSSGAPPAIRHQSPLSAHAE